MDAKEREALEAMGGANANIKHMLLKFTNVIAEKEALEAECKKEMHAFEAEKQALKTELETERKERRAENIAGQDKAEAQRIADAKKGSIKALRDALLTCRLNCDHCGYRLPPNHDFDGPSLCGPCNQVPKGKTERSFFGLPGLVKVRSPDGYYNYN